MAEKFPGVNHPLKKILVYVTGYVWLALLHTESMDGTWVISL
jgi:hypothetical protein